MRELCSSLGGVLDPGPPVLVRALLVGGADVGFCFLGSAGEQPPSLDAICSPLARRNDAVRFRDFCRGSGRGLFPEALLRLGGSGGYVPGGAGNRGVEVATPLLPPLCSCFASGFARCTSFVGGRGEGCCDGGRRGEPGGDVKSPLCRRLLVQERHSAESRKAGSSEGLGFLRRRAFSPF